MKRNKIVCAVACLGAALVMLSAFADCRAAPAPAPAVKKGSWFIARRLGEKTRLIDDHGYANMYLVEGEKAALLVDTGTGQRDPAAFVAGLTTLPVTVVNTHGHGDHAGGNRFFKQAYAHPADFDMIKAGPGGQTELVAVGEGFVFDLGGRKLTVIETPGHTAGSIVLLDAGNRMLFAGDNDNTQVWMFLNESLPLETYLATLEKLSRRVGEFEKIMPGHNEPLPASFIGEEIECAKIILRGECAGTPYKPYPNAFLCNYKSAGIVFNPDKLRASK